MNIILHVTCETTPVTINLVDSVMEKVARKSHNGARVVLQFDTESRNVQVAVPVVTNTDKEVIPVGSGVWIPVEQSCLVSNHRNIGVDSGPIIKNMMHSFIILGRPNIESFHSLQPSIIQRRVHDGYGSGEHGRWVGYLRGPGLAG